MLGGRGKAGGVKIAKSLSEVETYAKELLGKTLVTHQTGPEGKEIKRLYIEEGCVIQRILRWIRYHRATDQITLMASEEGGTEIEAVAARLLKIFKETIDPVIGLSPFQARRIAFNINIPKKSVNKAAKFLLALYNVFIEKDCSIVEINPLVTTADGDVLALDAKINFDDNALFRHKDVVEFT
ncbi:ATP-grasp domain-containing protein [Staphylococcus aureus]